MTITAFSKMVGYALQVCLALFGIGCVIIFIYSKQTFMEYERLKVVLQSERCFCFFVFSMPSYVFCFLKDLVK